jgi:hypothetical protein
LWFLNTAISTTLGADMKEYRSDRSVAFSRQTIKPCVCIIDSKHHIRSFFRYALDEFDLRTCAYADIGELEWMPKTQLPDLIVLGPSGYGKETADVLRALAENGYDGKVLLLGFDVEMLAGLQELGDKVGLVMLPALHAPFGSDALRDRVAILQSAVGRSGRRPGMPRTSFVPKLIVHSLPAGPIAQ